VAVRYLTGVGNLIGSATTRTVRKENVEMLEILTCSQNPPPLGDSPGFSSIWKSESPEKPGLQADHSTPFDRLGSSTSPG
jgi:hypothetical protein